MNLIELSVKRPVFVVMMVLAIITLGVIGYTRLPVDLMPNVEFPSITIYTSYSGASAEEIENLITKPMEDSLSTMEGLDNLSSTSSEGISAVTANFKLGVDVKFAEIKVREKVQAVKPLLPRDAKEPNILRMSSSDIELLVMSISGNQDLYKIRQLVDDVVKPKIEKIQGVGSMDIWGGSEKEVRISISKQLLAARGVNIDQIMKAVQGENVNFPVGVMHRQEKNMTVRVKGKFDSVEDIENLPIKSYSGENLRLKDVAKVDFTLKEETVRAREGGKNAIMFSVYKQSGANSIQVADSVAKELKNIVKSLPEGTNVKILTDTTLYIRNAVSGVQENIILGALLAILVVWLFLGNFRSTIITAVALPDSLLGAFFIVMLVGFSLNVILLMALSLAVGLLIDDSIVVRENIFRHIESGMDVKAAAIKGTQEVSMAVVATTMSIMAVFIPISFMQGIIGKMFSEFGFTIAFALLISLFDAFTTAPMLSAYWYKSESEKKSNIGKFFENMSVKWNVFYEKLNGIYTEILKWSLGHKLPIVAVSLVLFVASLFTVPFIGKGFFGIGDEGFFSVNVETYPGAPLEETDTYVKKVEQFIITQPAIESYFCRTGGGNMSNETNSGFFFIKMKPAKDRKITSKEESEIIKDYIRKNMGTDVHVYERGIGAEAFLSGSNDSNPIAIGITGDDLAKLEELGRQVKKIVQETQGAIDVNTSFKPAKPEVVVKLDRVKASSLGISTSDVGNALYAIIQGYKISDYNKGSKSYDIVMRMDKSGLSGLDDLKSLILTAADGSKVPLSAIANIYYSSAPVQILREDKQRKVKVLANLAKGYQISEVANKVRERIKQEVKFPEGYAYVFAGQEKQMNEMAGQMIMVIFLSVLFMYMILGSLYNSFVQPLILMISAPLAIIGALLALLITDRPLDMMGYIGILMVIGLVAKNAILLIDFTNKKREEGMSVREALMHAGPIRLRPILMTTFAMIFGMLPIALGLGEGSKGMESMPVAVIGGLLTSTFLTLVVIPVVYEWVEGRKKK
jgi:HAE1 family hydrophobic/amphiphilic exporter-1